MATREDTTSGTGAGNAPAAHRIAPAVLALLVAVLIVRHGPGVLLAAFLWLLFA